MKRLARLFLRFPSSRLADGIADATLAAYAADLVRFPLWAIDKAMIEAIDKGGAFAPSSPELRAACERAMLPIRLEAGEIRTVLEAEVFHEPDDDERRRVKDGFKALIADLVSKRPADTPRARVPADMTRQEAEQALADAQANPKPMPQFSEGLRRVLDLPSRAEDAA